MAPSGHDPRGPPVKNDGTAEHPHLPEDTMISIFSTGAAGGAVITPLRAPGLRAAIERAARHVGGALAAMLRRARRHIQVQLPVDAATLRDLGVSHTAVLASSVDPVERRPLQRCRA
jgi:hypothetical protein